MTLNDTKLKKEVNTDIAIFDFLTCQYDNEHSTMYAWCFKYRGEYTIGRTYEQFSNFLSHFTRGTDCYYLAYTADIRRFYTYFNGNVLNQQKKPIEVKIKPSKATSVEQYSQLTLNRLIVRDITKMVDIDMPKPTFDETLVRHSNTPLSVEENYLKARVDTIESNLIKYEITVETSWQSIQNKTRSIIRKHYNEMTDYEKVKYQCRSRVRSSATYDIIRNAVRGGVCMASADKIGVTLTDVGSFDAVSHYPSQLMLKKFPVEIVDTPYRYSPADTRYLSVFKIKFTNIKARNYNLCCMRFDDRKGDIIEQPHFEKSGNIYKAKTLITTMTNIDFMTYMKFYTWDSADVERGDLVVFSMDYLPNYIRKSVNEMFKAKEDTKGTPQGEINKAGLNSIWGLTSSRYETWKSYDMKRNRLFFCAWGAFITAYARQELLDRILKVGSDFVYCDTDNIKMINPEKHKYLFDLGKELGQWKDEGCSDCFKTLGKKKYIAIKKDKLDVTFSGIDKNSVLNTVSDIHEFIWGTNCGTVLRDCIIRQIICTDGIDETVVDYMGNEYNVKEKCYIYTAIGDFDMN